jgi:hypothetical protein
MLTHPKEFDVVLPSFYFHVCFLCFQHHGYKVNRHVCATAAVAGPEQVTLIGFSMDTSSLMEVVSASIFQQHS